MNQLTLNGVVFSGSAADLRALRAQFQCDHYIILPKLIEPDLLATILKRIESAPSVQKEDEGLIAESIIDDSHTYNLFLFLLNTPKFQRLFQRFAGCHRIADFQERIYQLNSTPDDRIVWDTDVNDHRMVTFSLNLTTQEYRGRVLAVEGDVPRTALAERFRCEKENVNFHTALRKALEHPRRRKRPAKWNQSPWTQ